MSNNSDWIESFRRWFVPKLGVLTQLLEDITGNHLYVTAQSHNNEFVGRVPMTEENFEKELHEMNFTRNPLAALKRLSSTGEIEEASFRKTDFKDAGDMQLHVVLYDGKKVPNADTGNTYVYAHWEKAWDKHPVQHYRAKGMNGPEGVRRMKKLLNEHGINHEPIRP